MTSNYRSHRRNKAFEQAEEHYRQSVPFGPTETARSSFQCGYEAPPTFRSSDVTSLASHFSNNKTSLLPSQLDQP